MRQPTKARVRSTTLLLVTLVGAVILLFPVYWMIVGSLLPTSMTLSPNPTLIPTHGVSFDSYISAMTSRPLARWLGNSALVTVAVTILSLIISVPAGYSLSRFRGAGPTSIGYTLLLARMLPSTMIAIPLFAVFAALGLINNLMSLIVACVTITVPFTAWMMKSFMDSVPRDLEHAAMVDGCSRFGALLRVVLPLTRPGIGAIGVYAAILSWSDLLFARTLITDPNSWTLPVGVTSFIGAHDIDWAGMLAAGTLAMLPMALLFALLEPFMSSGLTSGATTG